MQELDPFAARRFGLMTKFWEPGRVKTRLAKSWLRAPERFARWLASPSHSPELTEEIAFAAAAGLHRRFVCHLLANLRDCGTTRELIGSPPSQLPELQKWAAPDWQVTDQGEGNLGDRMNRWFAGHQTDRRASDGTSPRLLMIGGDCPLLDTGFLNAAWNQLDNHDLVLGPASDGGYYLIAMSASASIDQIAAVFTDISWSTSSVLAQTLDAAAGLGWKVAQLDQRDDIDTVDDLDQLLRQLSESKDGTAFFNELIEAMSVV